VGAVFAPTLLPAGEESLLSLLRHNIVILSEQRERRISPGFPSLPVGPSALAHALGLGFVAQPLLAVLLTGAGRLSLRQSRSVVFPNSVLLDFLIFNYHYVAGPMHPVAV
jgi:hypothetical protein